MRRNAASLTPAFNRETSINGFIYGNTPAKALCSTVYLRGFRKSPRARALMQLHCQAT
jgi:hypothetical protein